MVEVIKNQIQDRQNIFWLLTVALALSIGLYDYFGGHTVYNVTKHQDAERSIATLEGGISDLETTLMSLKSDITIDLARAKGFKDAAGATYISRKPLGKGLSLNNEI